MHFFFLCEHTHVPVQCLGPLSFLINPYNEHQANDSQNRCLQGTRYINTPTGLLARVKKATNPNQSHNFLFFSRVITKLFFFFKHLFVHPLAIFFLFKRSPTIGSPFQFTRINSLVLVGLTMPMNQENSYGQISESRLFFSLERTLKMTLKSFCPKLLK